MDRRKFLIFAGVSFTTGIAGCSEDSENGERTSTQTESNTRSPTQTDEQEDIPETVTEDKRAYFEFTEILPGDESIEQGKDIEIGANVENTGEVEASKEVTLEFEEEFTKSTEVDLQPGEDTWISQGINTSALDEKGYNYIFSTEDDEISAVLSISIPEIEEPATQSFSGTGQSIERGVEIEGGLTVVEASHNGESNFQVSLVDDTEFDNNFINVIGEFDGLQADLIDSGEYILEVNADGRWDIDIRQPRSATGDSLPRSSSGSGPDVIGPIEFEGTHIAEGSHSGESNFQVQVLPMEGRFAESVFNEIGEFEGQITFSFDGIGWVDINADGNWSITIE